MNKVFERLMAVQDLPSSSLGRMRCNVEKNHLDVDMYIICLVYEKATRGKTLNDYFTRSLGRKHVMNSLRKTITGCLTNPLVSAFSNQLRERGLLDKISIGSFLLISLNLSAEFESKIWCYSIFKAIAGKDSVSVYSVVLLAESLCNSMYSPTEQVFPTADAMQSLWKAQKCGLNEDLVVKDEDGRDVVFCELNVVNVFDHLPLFNENKD